MTMKASRRGFFGTLFGGMIAAPLVAKGMIESPDTWDLLEAGQRSVDPPPIDADAIRKYRQQFIDAFEERHSLLRQAVVHEASVPLDQVTFIVA